MARTAIPSTWTDALTLCATKSGRVGVADERRPSEGLGDRYPPVRGCVGWLQGSWRSLLDKRRVLSAGEASHESAVPHFFDDVFRKKQNGSGHWLCSQIS